MESQQLSQHSPISHGSACASVTSKEVQTTQDPLDISASKTEECEKVPTQANSQQTTTPTSSAVPENPHHASPQPVSYTHLDVYKRQFLHTNIQKVYICFFTYNIL